MVILFRLTLLEQLFMKSELIVSVHFYYPWYSQHTPSVSSHSHTHTYIDKYIHKYIHTITTTHTHHIHTHAYTYCSRVYRASR